MQKPERRGQFKRSRNNQSIDAMAVIYMVTTLIWLLIALRFVDPTQIVTRVKQEAR